MQCFELACLAAVLVIWTGLDGVRRTSPLKCQTEVGFADACSGFARKLLAESRCETWWSLKLLAHHPLSCGFLAMPGLQQLLGDSLQGLQVCRGVDGAAHALELEFLAET